MRFRPCIDIHNGKVKQIVGSSLSDKDDRATENFVSEKSAADFAYIYREKGLSGGHVIVLNGKSSSYYEDSKRAALTALSSFPGGMQYGGGVDDENAAEFLDAGASHVIVTSFVFKGGVIRRDNLKRLREAVGRGRLVLDLSCRRRDDGNYYVVTDRWQNFTDFQISKDNLGELSKECDEFLIHGVDVEGKSGGVDPVLIELMAEIGDIPMTYAGGIRSGEDIEVVWRSGRSRVDFTVGSALSLFGGSLSLEEIQGFMSTIAGSDAN